MEIYKKFAEFYTNGQYPEYSMKMAEILPDILMHFKINPVKILDIACGEGTFAIEMAKMGYNIVGLDQSEEMLAIAENKSRDENLEIEFLKGDMRELKLNDKFNLVTCWFDSLNYILKSGDLSKTFKGIYRALKENGYFIFDMNTIFALSTLWQEHPCSIERETDEIVEIHQTSYDSEKQIATLKITIFKKDNNHWYRVDETHRERGYSINLLKKLLKKAGFEIMACWLNPRDRIEIDENTPRVWFVTKKYN